MNGEIDAFIVKCSAGYKTAGQCQKYQICMQDKLHAGQYRLGVARPFLMLEAFFLTLP